MISKKNRLNYSRIEEISNIKSGLLFNNYLSCSTNNAGYLLDNFRRYFIIKWKYK